MRQESTFLLSMIFEEVAKFRAAGNYMIWRWNDMNQEIENLPCYDSIHKLRV